MTNVIPINSGARHGAPLLCITETEECVELRDKIEKD